ncbi:hypothetical protein Pyn_07923 [Prunus yedoensis var. nudiflora]|uniref:Uncharacterized protein n=1 Tax=Prunus yedoensis var. nudiflora TaxID=2094558 RepID=A0A314YZK8_PRUYE|nr:hypothetical protein Pyn_07923 [Prunus yedoensis var. nudiflora]
MTAPEGDAGASAGVVAAPAGAVASVVVGLEADVEEVGGAGGEPPDGESEDGAEVEVVGAEVEVVGAEEEVVGAEDEVVGAEEGEEALGAWVEAEGVVAGWAVGVLAAGGGVDVGGVAVGDLAVGDWALEEVGGWVVEETG